MSRRARTAARERSPFEWTILIAAIAAIAVIVIALIASGLSATSGPPDLQTSVRRAGERSDGVAIEVTVRNVGGETAENVEIDVTVGSEARTLSLTAVARDDEERGIVVFPPGTTGAPRAEVQSYSETAR